MFRNRQRELGYLERRYARAGAEFAVLYGRRRVGKSSLIYEWCRQKPHLYFFAARLPGPVLLHEFGQQLAAALGQPERTFADWDSALLIQSALARERRQLMRSSSVQDANDAALGRRASLALTASRTSQRCYDRRREFSSASGQYRRSRGSR